MAYAKNLTEARGYRYGVWAGEPNGRAYRDGYCAFEVFPAIVGMHHQCSRANGYGPAKLYCSQHAGKVLKGLTDGRNTSVRRR